MASKMAQDTSRRLKIASDMPPRGSTTAPRRFQVLFEPSRAPPKMPKSFKNLKKTCVCLTSRLLASDGLLRPQDGPKMAQERPKRAPRGLQDGHKSAQERPKTAPRGDVRAPKGGRKLRTPPSLIDGLQDGPKRPSRGSKRPRRELQDGPKTPLKSPRRTPRGDFEGS